MKKITVALREFAEPAVKPEPATKPAQPATKPAPGPSTPPKPKVMPTPKNLSKTFLGTLDRMMSRMRKISKMNEATDIDSGLDPKLNPALKKGTGDNMEVFRAKSAESAGLSGKIAQMESAIDTGALEAACEEIVREIFGRDSARFDISQVEFDLRIVRDPAQASALDPRAVGGNKKMGASVAQLHKRRIANFITQGFAFSAFSKLFDEGNQAKIDFIDSAVQRMYFKYFEALGEANSRIPIVEIKKLISDLAKMPPGEAVKAAGGIDGGRAIQATVRVEYGERPKIVAEGNNFITLFHEAVKGVFELVSHWGLAGYTEDELNKIYSETDGWVEEFRAFKYGGKVVDAFVKFLGDVAKRSGDASPDHASYAGVLAWLYNQENLPDQEFVTFMEAVISGKPSESDYGIGERAYKFVAHGIESVSPSQADVSDMTMDELLDKVSKVGMQGLTPEERARLDMLAANENESLKFYVSGKAKSVYEKISALGISFLMDKDKDGVYVRTFDTESYVAAKVAAGVR